MARAAADVEHRPWRRRQLLQQLLVHHIGAHASFHRRIGSIHELVSQASPDVIAHGIKV